jgi:hypothetical protein
VRGLVIVGRVMGEIVFIHCRHVHVA